MIDWITQIILQIDIVFLLVLFFSEKENPSRILLWAIVMIFLPLVGLILYLVVGQTFYSEHKFKRKGLKDDEIDNIVPDGRDIIAAESDPDYRRTAGAILNAGGLGYSNNNDVKLYTLGEDKFRDLYDDLRNAKRYIHLEYYIIRDDELGNELMDILKKLMR